MSVDLYDLGEMRESIADELEWYAEALAYAKAILADIEKEADEELERIEKHGGCAGFALRIKSMVLYNALCEATIGRWEEL